MEIQAIDAYQIYDSRGNPTLEAVVTLENGGFGLGTVPTGASRGQYEALELRDRNFNLLRGNSVFKAIEHIKTEITPHLIGQNVFDQSAIDKIMINLDGTENKSRLGANAILAVSMAVANAAAKAQNVPLYEYLGHGQGNLLPLPEIQIFGGGAHANWRTDVQDFLIIAVDAQSYQEALEITHNVYHAAGDIIKAQDKYYGLADEGGYWPEFETHEAIFRILLAAIRNAGYMPGQDVAISLDIAASDLYDGNVYRFALEEKTLSTDEFVDLIIAWCEKYPIISLEDPLADTDWYGWKKIFDALGHKIQLIGDDLFTTNTRRIRHGITQEVANAVLIKPNQIGTVSETLEAINMTQETGWLPVISARSGETEDTFITHLAVATNAGQLKVGSFARSERMAKWNEGLRIERQLGDKVRFAGSRLNGISFKWSY